MKKLRCLTALLFLLTAPAAALAQPGGNWVRTDRMLDSLQAHAVTTYQFFDGRGRPVLSATNGLGTGGSYVYTLQTYDAAGNVCRRWLPVTGTSSVQLPDESDVSSQTFSQYGDGHGYSSFVHDALGRQTESVMPGDAWHAAGKRKTVSHIINRAADNTSYPAGSLTGETATDEDGHAVTVWNNLRGMKVMEKRGTGNITQYIYNGLGLLAGVLMPGHNPADPNHTSYGYEYDELGRMVKKRLPGTEYIQYWYDHADRVAFMQDGMLRQKGRYRFMLYDTLGRLAVQGTCGGGGLSAVASATPTVTFTQNSGGFLSTDYVISNGVSITAPSLEMVYYYDGYAFLSGSMAGRFSPIAAQNGICVRGRLTGSVTALSNGGFVCSLTLYDDRGRVTETRSTTPDASLTEIATTSYTFTGDTQTEEYRLLRSGQGTAFIARTASTFYTASGMPHTAGLQVGLNSSQPTSSRTIQTVTYNGLGQIASVARSGSAGTVSYLYDLHGWVTNITTPSFREELFYASDGGSSGTPCYNGNVCVQKWSNGNYAKKRGYMFRYDELNRLTEGTYGERETLDHHENYYNEKIVEYYPGGAVKRMQRRGRKNDGERGKVDNLHITVRGNRLHYVTDDAEKLLYDGAFDFDGDGSNSSAFAYNANGSLIKDTGKGIMFIGYDDNGMPRRIQFADGSVTEYVYTATGRKMRAIYYTAVPGITVHSGQTHQLTNAEILSKDSIDYLGELIMENGVPSQYLFPGGYCSLRDGGNASVAFHYYNRDHLGNNREVVNESGALEQVTHYYPFGAPFCERTTAGANTNATLQRYKYNGKELDLMHGLKWYDYGARMYDPILVTWTSIDPLCEKYYNVSPYAYCHNNPVIRIDPNGEYDFIGINNNQYYPVIAVYPNNDIHDGGAIEADYTAALNSGMPIMLVENIKDYADAMSHLHGISSYSGAYTLNSHGFLGNETIPTSFKIGDDRVDADTDFSVLRNGLENHTVFIGACSVGSIIGRGLEMIINMEEQTNSTIIAPVHPLNAGYAYDGSNNLNNAFFHPPTLPMDNEFVIAYKGDLQTINNVTIEKNRGISWDYKFPSSVLNYYSK